METNLDWFEIIIKLIMAIALMIIFRQYYSMKKELMLSRLFNLTLFEEQYRIDEIMSVDRNKAITTIKDNFSKKVNEQFKDKMIQPKIQKMIDEYFRYHIQYGIE